MSPIVSSSDQIQAIRLPDAVSRKQTVQQQLESLRRVQEAADKRVKLGMQIYRAAEAQSARHQLLLESFKDQQRQLKEELQEDMTRSLQSYDQWVGKIDEDFTTALQHLEDRIDKLQANWAESQERIDSLMQRSEKLLDQSRSLVASAAEAGPSPQVADATAAVDGPPVVTTTQISDSADEASAALSEVTQAPAVQVKPASKADADGFAAASGPAAKAEPPEAPDDAEPSTGDRFYQNVVRQLDRRKTPQPPDQSAA